MYRQMNPVTTEDLLPARRERTRKRRKLPEERTPLATPEWRTPWIDSLPMTEYENVEQRLHDEVVAFVSFMSPSTQEIRARELVLGVVKNIIERRFTTCTVSAYGSVAYGLSLPGGDLDLVVQTSEVYAKNYLIRALFQLSSMFKNAGITTNSTVISHARVPIIKLEVLPSLGAIQFDINLNSADGLKAVPVIKRYLDELPALRSLVLIVKVFLANKNLQSAATGGLSSYAIICIVIGFLKVNPNHRDEKYIQTPVGSGALGALLLDFFDFYGNTFPYETSYISPTEGKILSKEHKGWLNAQLPLAFAIQCLVDPSNDVGKSAQKIRHIREAFQEAFQTLQSYRLSLHRGNVLGSILGISDETLSFRGRIRELVDSGALEKALAAVVLPPPRRPPPPVTQRRERRPHENFRRSSHGYSPYLRSSYDGEDVPYDHHHSYAGGSRSGYSNYTHTQDTSRYPRPFTRQDSRSPDYQSKRRRV